VLLALMALAACQGAAKANDQTPTAGAPASQAAPVLVTASQPAPGPVTAGLLTVTITSPADETVVNVPQVDVVGQAPAQAVISINDNVVVASATGQFSTTVPLQEGPNEIDVVASDVEGNEVSTQLIVTYDPPG
jgi:Glucodextranase, domain B